MNKRETGQFVALRGTIRPGSVKQCVPRSRNSVIQAILDLEGGRSCTLIFGAQSESYITISLEGVEVMIHGALDKDDSSSSLDRSAVYVSVIAAR